MRTIRVTGNSKIAVSPTLMRVSISLEGLEIKFDDTVERSSNDTEKIKEIVEKLGLDRKSLKTLDFEIKAEFERYYDERDRYKTRFEGYKYSHRMYIEFPIDNRLLGDLLYALVKSDIEPKFNMGYTIEEAEKKKYKDILIEDSVKNAKERAEALARAAEVKLGKIVTIDYSDERYDFYRDVQDFEIRECFGESVLQKSTYDFDIEADDITISDSVNMVWEIE